mgnify:FL=1
MPVGAKRLLLRGGNVIFQRGILCVYGKNGFRIEFSLIYNFFDTSLIHRKITIWKGRSYVKNPLAGESRQAL